MTPTPGSSVRMVFRKWGDRPHWEYDAVVLGQDEHGAWLGAPAGTELTRPGAAFATAHGFVALVPPDAGFVATFYVEGATTQPEQPEGCVEVYVDVATVPRWDPGPPARVVAVDLDLDVARGRAGRVWVDDEDEFADHRVRFGYPPHVVAAATATCAEVHEALTGRRTPFDGATAAAWLSRLPAPSAAAATGHR